MIKGEMGRRQSGGRIKEMKGVGWQGPRARLSWPAYLLMLSGSLNLNKHRA